MFINSDRSNPPHQTNPIQNGDDHHATYYILCMLDIWFVMVWSIKTGRSNPPRRGTTSFVCHACARDCCLCELCLVCNACVRARPSRSVRFALCQAVDGAHHGTRRHDDSDKTARRSFVIWMYDVRTSRCSPQLRLVWWLNM